MSYFEVVFTGGDGNPLYIRNIKKFWKAKREADSVGGEVWVYYMNKLNILDRQKIYPKQQPQLTYSDLRELNDVLVRRFTKNEIPNSMMFNYTVEVGDYSLDGFSKESRFFGKNRDAAFRYWKEGKEWLGCARIIVETAGRRENTDEPEEDSWKWLFEDDE